MSKRNYTRKAKDKILNRKGRKGIREGRKDEGIAED